MLAALDGFIYAWVKSKEINQQITLGFFLSSFPIEI